MVKELKNWRVLKLNQRFSAWMVMSVLGKATEVEGRCWSGQIIMSTLAS